MVDPKWSTEEVRVVHDGCEAARVDKVERIAEVMVALRHLRVCESNRGGRINCGRCGRCLRVMAALRLAGALDKCPVFAQPLDLEAVAQMDLTELYARTVAETLLARLEARRSDPDLTQAVRIAVERVQPRIMEQQEREIAELKEVLASTQAWARELEAALARDRDWGRINRVWPLRAARRVRQAWSRR